MKVFSFIGLKIEKTEYKELNLIDSIKISNHRT